MKLRLEGTKQEIDWLVESLGKTYSVTKPAKLYPNRDGQSYRAYVELVPFFVVSRSLDSDDQVQSPAEPQPKPGDMVLGDGNG